MVEGNSLEAWGGLEDLVDLGLFLFFRERGVVLLMGGIVCACFEDGVALESVEEVVAG